MKWVVGLAIIGFGFFVWSAKVGGPTFPSPTPQRTYSQSQTFSPRATPRGTVSAAPTYTPYPTHSINPKYTPRRSITPSAHPTYSSPTYVPPPAPQPTLTSEESDEPWNRPGPDLDCPDIGHSVRITGPDYHRLDRDGDGIGCESYGY